MYNIKDEIVKALRNDSKIRFREVKNELRDGRCPSCGHKELFVSLEEPWRVQCRRHNRCNYSESTRSLYPEIFENLSEKFPPSEQNPNVTADAYMQINRSFSPEIVSNMYHQAYRKTKSGTFAQTIRFPLWDNHYWERIIDAKNVRENEGKKAHISYNCKFQSKGWVPPLTEFKEKDKVFITEGIFKSLAFLHLRKKDVKTIASISCSNLPRDIINENKGKNITWILANDNDKAGINYARKYKKEIEAMGERCLIAFPEVGEDWDDVFRAGRLTDKYIEESIWRGYYILANSAKQKAFFYWARFRKKHHVFNYKNYTWSYKIDMKKLEKDEDFHELEKDISSEWSKFKYLMIGHYVDKFAHVTRFKEISICWPVFKYQEIDPLTEERTYTFEINYPAADKHLINTEGASLDSPSKFHTLLKRTTDGASFRGSIDDFEFLDKKWFPGGTPTKKVVSIPYVGYDADSSAYIFKDFAYHKGKYIPLNEDGYITTGKHHIKTRLKSIDVAGPNRNIYLDWVQDYFKAFHFNGMVLLSWWIGSFFAEQIREMHEKWPFLEMSGEPATGKSTQIEFLWRCVGRKRFEGYDPMKDSKVATARHFQQVSNLPMVIMESDRDKDIREKKQAFDIEMLKPLYNGRGIRSLGVAKKGADTDDIPFRGAVLLDQNATIDAKKETLQRIVHCHCTTLHHSALSLEKRNIIADLKINTVGGLLSHVISLENKFLSIYSSKYDELINKFHKKGKHINSRLLENHAQVAACSHILPLIFGSQNVSNEFCTDIEDFIFSRCEDRQQRLQSDHPLVEQFWEYYEDLNFHLDSSGNTYQTLNHADDETVIAINMSEFMNAISVNRLNPLNFADLKKLLPNCNNRKYKGTGIIKSKLSNSKRQSKRCWFFESVKKDKR